MRELKPKFNSTRNKGISIPTKLYWFFYCDFRLKGYTPRMSKKKAKIEYKKYFGVKKND